MVKVTKSRLIEHSECIVYCELTKVGNIELRNCIKSHYQLNFGWGWNLMASTKKKVCKEKLFIYLYSM